MGKLIDSKPVAVSEMPHKRCGRKVPALVGRREIGILDVLPEGKITRVIH